MKLKALFYPDVKFETLFIPYIFREIYIEKIYDEVLKKFPLRSMTIIDVGANIGAVTQFLQPYATKLYAIEPSSEHFEALSKNKEYNEWDNVETFKLAIADADGETTLFKKPDNLTMNSIEMGKRNPDGTLVHPMKTRHPYGEPEIVKTKSLDTFFKENNIVAADFMKLDVEGAEELILKSDGFKSVAPIIKNMLIEFHFKDFQKLVDYIESLGFTGKRLESEAIVYLFHR